MSTEKPSTPPQTVDQVVAANLRRLRDKSGLSRSELAERLTERTSTEWSRWKIVDLEGARSKRARKPPRPATWADLVAIALALEITVFDLVLPVDEDTEVVVARFAEVIDHGVWPDEERIPERLRGTPKTSTRGYHHKSDRDEIAKLLFRLPGEWLTADKLERLAQQGGFDLEDAMVDIAEVKQGLERALETLELHRQQHGDKEIN